MIKIHHTYSFFLKWIKVLVLFFFVPLKASNNVDFLQFSDNDKISSFSNDVDEAFSLIKLGDDHKLNQQYEKSLIAYQKSLQIFKQNKKNQDEFYVYTKLAELYRYRRQYSKAKDYIVLCDKILKTENIKDAYLMSFYSRKAALLSEYENRKDSALTYSQRALFLSQKLKDSETELISLMEIAGIYESTNNYSQAIQQLKIIQSLAKENGNIQVLCDAMVNLSRNYTVIKNYKEATKIALSGLEIAKRHKLSYNQLLFTDNLQVTYEKLGDYESALKYLRIRLKLTEDYYNQLYDDKVLEYEEKFQAAEKVKIINDNIKLLEIKEEELKRQNLIKYFILFGLLSLLVFIFVLANNIRTIKKQNKVLTIVSEQNNFLVSETHHRINNNLQLVRILIESELNKNPNIDNLSNKRIIAKIDSMGILHRKLYKNQDKKRLDLKDFLFDIRHNLDFIFEEHKVKVRFEIDQILLPINSAMYIGLLVTELCINSLKHAFCDQDDKKIQLRVYIIENKIYFHYEDNGTTKNEITKLDLVDKLCRQLKVDYRIDNNHGFKLNFNLKLETFEQY